MPATRTISLPDDLLSVIENMAREDNKTPQDVIRAAVEHLQNDAAWQSIVEYGHDRAKLLGVTEADVERLIAETRRQRER